MKHWIAALALLFAQFLLPLSPSASEPQCLDCHPDKREEKVVHPAIDMGCSSCHVGNHQGEKPAPKLTTTVPDLCFTCHDKTAFDKKVLHAPVAGGMCGSCHNPHASDNPRMLIAAVPDLCFSSHDKNALGKKDAHVKAAAGKGQAQTPTPDPSWEAMLPFVNGERPITVHADEVRLVPTQRRYNAAGLPWGV